MRRVESRESRVESQQRSFALRSRSGPRPSTLSPRPCSGVTLVELLIVIVIISILAGLILGVASVAGETAREAHSRHMVERLHTLLTDYYNTFKTRRVRLQPGVEQEIQNELQRPAERGQALAEARLYALREMILMEIPDRWSDVILKKVEDFSLSAQPIQPLYLNARTDLSNMYLRRYRSLIGRTNTLASPPRLNNADDIKLNQGAECLYLVITLATGDGEARGQFAEKDIGDTDGDGAPEFLDGWGHPISFLRWAPGFDSQIQLNLNVLDGMTPSEANLAVAKDHDPFDVFRRDAKAFRLAPLIYSPGRDEATGLYVATDYVTWLSKARPKIDNRPPYVKPQLTPYVKGSPAWPDDYLGTKLDETATDDIHNHLLGER